MAGTLETLTSCGVQCAACNFGIACMLCLIFCFWLSGLMPTPLHGAMTLRRR